MTLFVEQPWLTRVGWIAQSPILLLQPMYSLWITVLLDCYIEDIKKSNSILPNLLEVGF